MKVQMTYNGKTVEVEVADEQFEKLFTEIKTGYEKSENYYLINAHGEVIDPSDNKYLEKKRYEFANYFSDKTVAENMARAQRLWNRIHRRAVELCEPIQTTQTIQYYVISYDVTLNKVVVGGWTTFRGFGAVYFDTEAHCKQVIDEFWDELLWYFTEFKDRADM